MAASSPKIGKKSPTMSQFLEHRNEGSQFDNIRKFNLDSTLIFVHIFVSLLCLFVTRCKHNIDDVCSRFVCNNIIKVSSSLS